MFREKEIAIEILPGDEEILKHTVDFVSFSYYASRCASAEMNAGNTSAANVVKSLKNPYIEASEWGWAIDPVGLLPFLKEIHEIDTQRLREASTLGLRDLADCYVVSRPDGSFATTSYVRRAFKTFSETNGLMGTNDELITFHGLRHTFATQWIRQGGDIKALQSILGHKDAMATLNVYADIEPISKIHNMLRATPCLWRGHLGPRVDPGPMFQQRIQESIETLQAFGYGITEPDDRNIAIRDVKTNSWL